MKTKIAFLLASLVFVAIGAQDGMLKNNEVLKLTDVSYFIAEPGYLRPYGKTAENDSMNRVIATTVDSFLSLAQVKGWKKIDQSENRQFTMSFNQDADRESGRVAKLPYTVAEYCSKSKMKTLVAFYFYKTDFNKEIVSDGTTRVISPISRSGAGTTVDVPIALENIQFACAVYSLSNQKLDYYKSTNDENYVCYEEIVDKLFGNFGFNTDARAFKAIYKEAFRSQYVDGDPIVSAIVNNAEIRNKKKEMADERSAKNGKIVVGEPTFSENVEKKGGRSSKAFKEVIEFNNTQLIDGYCQRLSESPTFAGQLKLRFSIDGDGNVTESKVTSSTMNDPQFDSDFANVIKSIKFYPTTSSDIVTIEYPITFSPQKKK